MKLRRPLLALCALSILSMGALSLSGCDSDYEPRWERALDVDGPYQIGDDLVYINRTMRQVIRLDALRQGQDIKLEIDRAKTGPQPSAAVVGVNDSSLLLLDDEAKTLSVYDMSGDTLSVKTIKLQSAYDKITLDPQGEFVLLSFGDVLSQNVIARNLNEVAIIKLDGNTPQEPVYVTLSSRAKDLVFADPFELGGQTQRLVAALSDAEVTLLDLNADNEDDRLREVPLTLSEAERPPTPLQAIFDVQPGPDASAAASLYLLTDNGQDITQINIQPSARENALKLDLSVNQLAAGENPSRMALIDLGEQGHRLMVLEERKARFTLVDTVSGEGSTFALPMDRGGDELMVYTSTRQVDGQPVSEPRVLVYSFGSPLVSVVSPGQIALAGDSPTQGRSVEAVRLEAIPSRIDMDQSQSVDRAVVFHPGLKGGFTVLNLRTNRDIPIQGHSLEAVTFSGAYAYGVFRGTNNMGIFELATGHPSVFELPLQGKSISIDEREGLIIVQHTSNEGTFTVLDAESPTPKNALVKRDVFLTELFDQEISQ